MPEQKTSAVTQLFTLRRATAQDAKSLAEFGAKTFCDNFAYLYKPENLAAYLKESFSEDIQRGEIENPYNTHFIAEVGGKLAGYVKLAECKMPIEAPVDPALEMHRLYIDAPYQGMGIGKALMSEVLAEAQSMQAASVYLSVWENNPRAQGFYRSFGFHKIAEYDFYVGEQTDNEWIMELVL